MDLNTALKELPHGPEFRFLDEMVSLDPGKSGEAEFVLKGDEAFLKGHFPDAPIMPGVLLTEGIAQLAGVVAQADPDQTPLADLRLTAMRSVKIFGAVVPGERIRFRVAIEGRMGPLLQAKGTAAVGENLLAKAQITLSGRVV